eukprot:3468061-Rhodomonas_salina.1
MEEAAGSGLWHSSWSSSSSERSVSRGRGEEREQQRGGETGEAGMRVHVQHEEGREAMRRA